MATLEERWDALRADGVAERAMMEQAEAEADAIRVGIALVLAEGEALPPFEIEVEGEQAHLRCSGLAKLKRGKEILAAIQAATHGIGERVKAAGMAGLMAALRGERSEIVDPEPFRVETTADRQAAGDGDPWTVVLRS